ncbi:MAG TPA: TonB-dependent receptor [Lacunisphaera sp.]|nr:TonB-dependent receptor [Lacunisphaera sp.]
MQKSFIKSLVLTAVTALAVLLVPAAHAQGVVSGGITGTLLDNTGKPVSGASVTVVHEPTNTTYTAITGDNGRFKVSGLRVGGPYTVSASASGVTVKSLEGVQTGLGEDTDVMLYAASEVLQLEKLVTTADVNDLDSNATGAGSVLSNRGVLNQPTSTRSFADMMKTNPFVTVRAFPQITALGMNNRYNSISIDGARQNDQFGLASSGLFSLKNPFSLDAVENFSISLTPYDVTQSGFAGASVNVVSKSGTNEFHGSAYYLYTSDKWQGKDVSGTNIGKRPATFYERTWGATLGGPIIKNRLFFFLNYEKFSNPSGGPTNAGFNPDSAFLTALGTQISALPGSPNLGSFGAAGSALQEDEKKLAKLDWNITKDHRLSVRYSETVGNQPFNPDFNSTGAPSTFPSISPAPSFTNGVTTFVGSKSYNLAVEEKVWASQLFSNWTPNLRTELAYSKNDSTSLRSTPVNFPEVVILGVPGTSTTGTAISTNDALLIGTDFSSMGNGVISNSTAFSGNATYNWNDYTFKAGFDHEETDFENLFRNGSYGRFVYNYTGSAFNLANDTPLAFQRNVASSGFPGTDISTFEQTGWFGQVKWEPSNRLSLAFGLRYDALGSPIAPTNNPAFFTAFGVRNDGTIDGTSRLAPRFAFNYSVDNDRKVQIRGGAGVFLGRNPWVWISNSYGNAGFGRFTRTFTGSTARPTLAQYLNGTFADTDPVYKFDPNNPLGTTTATTGGGDVAFLVDGLKLPTNLRGNLAVDMKLPKLDSTFSVEWIHTDVLEGLFYSNINLVPGGKGADNRTYFRRFTSATNTTLVPLGTSGGLVNTFSTAFSRGLRLSNADVGQSDYIAFAFDRPFKDGWAFNATYTRGRATEAQPAGSSTASSQYAFNIVFNQGEVEESRSDYEIRDRIQLTFSKEFSYFKRYKTVASLYYEGRSGQPYSYVYSGDLNFDGNSANDTLSVPVDANDPRFNFASMTSAQQNAYFAFLNSSGLSKYAGSHAPRNAFIGPWQNRLDLHLSQEVKVMGPVGVEVFADFINFGSWLSDDMFNYVETLGANTSNSNQNRVLGNATYGADGRLIPTVSIDANNNVVLPAASQFLPNNTDARWRIVAGVRVKF